jgi:agmatine deiminase
MVMKHGAIIFQNNFGQHDQKYTPGYAIVPATRRFHSFYHEVTMIPDWETNTVLISDQLPQRHSGISQQLERILTEHDIPLRVIPNTADIWVRDAAPVQVAPNRFVQFRYAPDYLQGQFEHLITAASVFQNFGITPDTMNCPLTVDGGNVVGTRSAAILTNKVLRENAMVSPEDICRQLQNTLQVSQIILVPREPYDVIGHSDGMIRFVSDNQVIINDYTSINPGFCKKLESTLTRAGLSFTRIPYVPEDVTRNGIPSAAGNYVNFLRVRNLIIVPSYDIPEDRVALDLLRSVFKASDTEICQLSCRELAEEGGVLNCVTWTVATELITTNLSEFSDR